MSTTIIGARLDGRYRIEERVARGASAWVYRGVDEVTGAACAMKVLAEAASPEVQARFQGEMELLSQLHHPYIVPVYAVGVVEGLPYMVMDYADGGSILDRRNEDGPLTGDDASVLAIQVLSALAEAHAQGIVHRDVKAGNVLVDDVGNGRLCDFGIARYDAAARDLTSTGTSLGTFLYMAPEQRLDARRADLTVDLYGVGSLLFRLTTEESPADLFTAERDAPRWDTIPAALRPIIWRATRPTPAERWPDARSMAEALLATLPPERRAALLALPSSDPAAFPEPSASIRPAGVPAERTRRPAAPPRPMRTHPFAKGSETPLVVEPAGDPSVDALVEWLVADRAATDALLTRHGALLFRGFEIDGPEAFERVARAVDPDLQNNYLGTSPRDALTPYVFTASELPGHYPIPQHAEMTFLPEPPRRLFFCGLRPNTGPGGETPLADLRAVYRDLDPTVRARWESRGLRIVRNYGGPEGQGKRDPRQLKRWDQMFGTTDRAEIERVCAIHQFTPTWRADGRLRLVSTHSASRPHPTTGEPVWFNHAHVFHGSVGPGEYARIATRMGAWPWRGWQLAATVLGAWQRLGADPEDAAMHVTFADGGAIPEADFEAVRTAIWKHMVFPRWEKGDVTAIDNRSISHGRMPYSGDRLVAVCWA